VWYRADDTRHEHQWAAALLAAPDTTVPVPRFGASDCTCAAHLVGLSHEPHSEWLMALLGVSLDSHTRR
jgi:Uri superfamily endonuclease